jgi:hypothetical protein
MGRAERGILATVRRETSEIFFHSSDNYLIFDEINFPSQFEFA